MNNSQRPVRVAVVGGGCGALTTAFELTRPKHKGKFEVTVYQMGWRLGGKGASGRGVADRVEEHGLHLWMGFYENAFRLMRECYTERKALFPNARFACWREAFHPAPDVGVADRSSDGWEFWLAHFPPGEGEPGDPNPHASFTVSGYLRQSLMLIGELLRSAAAMESASDGAVNPDAPDGRTSARGPEAFASSVSTLLRYGQLATAAALIQVSETLREAIDGFFPMMLGEGASVALQILGELAAIARRQLNLLVEGDRELRRVWQVIDLVLAIVRGSIRHGLAVDPRGFDAINDYDWRDWLRRNGASEPSLNCGFLQGMYDLAFAFEDGDVKRPRLAAGVALRGAVRMFFTYRGSFFWRMNAGMGDIVFAPLYQVLKHRGVHFEFFHRLRNLGLSSHQEGVAPYVQDLQFDVQARIEGGGEYEPLVAINDVPSWPSHPDYAQLANGDVLARDGLDFEAIGERRRAGTRTLKVTRDFDFVVLGVSIGALPSVARELIDREPSWRNMVRHVKTVPTQAFQIWMRESTYELGWKHPPMNLSGFVEPFDTWADMSHLIPEESWNEHVKSIAYFCSVLPDEAKDGLAVTSRFHQRQHNVVRRNAVRFLENDVRALWPNAAGKDGGFRWEVLAAADATPKRARRTGKDRFETQYWRANVNPTDRFVQSLPGSIIHRVSPLDMTFDNLTIAGDWTASGLDSGCIESAVMSGLLAANAIAGEPELEDIVGYDHP